MKRIAQLDGIRGIAILLVLVWHYLGAQIKVEPHSFLSYFVRSLSLASTGVDLFFVLSGFLIVGILIDHRGAPNYYQVFFLRRVCRTFPLYFLLLILFASLAATSAFVDPAFAWLFAHPLPLWSYATFTQNISMGLRGDFGPHWLSITWSLAVEEQFYLIVPLLVCILSRKTVFTVFLVAFLLAPLLRCAFPGFHADVNTLWRADSLLSGACLAVLMRSPHFVAMVQRNKQFLFALLGTLLAGAALMTVRPFGAFSYFWLAELYSVLILVALVDGDGWIGRLIGHRILVWFGALSYGIYMFHQAVSGLLHGLIRGGEPAIRTVTDAGVTGMALLMTLLLAMLSYRFLEQPILRFGHRFRYGQSSSKEPSTEPSNALALEGSQST